MKFVGIFLLVWYFFLFIFNEYWLFILVMDSKYMILFVIFIIFFEEVVIEKSGIVWYIL